MNGVMENKKDFNEWRAEKLGYVYFSRLNELIIKEAEDNNAFFDYLIDIGESQKQTGRLFGVEVKALNGTPINFKSVAEQYKNISFPVLLVAFDNKIDKGYFTWIKQPQKGGRLLFENKTNLHKLDNNSLSKIVKEVKEWYAHQAVA